MPLFFYTARDGGTALKRYRIGAIAILCLTLALTYLIYRVGYSVPPTTEALEVAITEKLDGLVYPQEGPYHPRLLRVVPFRGRVAVLFTLQEDEQVLGLASFQKGFNQLYRPVSLTLSNRHTLGHTVIRAGGQKNLLIYAHALDPAVVRFEVRNPAEAKPLLLSQEVSGKDWIYIYPYKEYRHLIDLYGQLGAFPEVEALDAEGKNLLPDWMEGKNPTWYIDERYADSANRWALFTLVVGFLLVFYALRLDQLERQYHSENRQAKVLSSLIMQKKEEEKARVRR